MEQITLNGRKFRPFITNDIISRAIDEVAAKINADFRDSKD